MFISKKELKRLKDRIDELERLHPAVYTDAWDGYMKMTTLDLIMRIRALERELGLRYIEARMDSVPARYIKDSPPTSIQA